MESIEPFMTRQVVKINLDDVIDLLIEEQPKFISLSSNLRDQLKTIGRFNTVLLIASHLYMFIVLDPGSIVYKYIPPDK